MEADIIWAMFLRSMELGRTSKSLIVERSKAIGLYRYYVLEVAAGFFYKGRTYALRLKQL